MTDTDLDIVKRLRMVQGDNEEAREAADMIERLRASLAEWKALARKRNDEDDRVPNA